MSSWRNVRVACVFGFVSVAAASACGGSSSNPGQGATGGAEQSGGANHGGAAGRSASAGGGGKTGAAGAPATVKCGTATCSAVTIPGAGFNIPACCADAATNQCGLDGSTVAQFGLNFAEACQPKDQPGVADETCPDSPSAATTAGFDIQFAGCCRPNGSCGYLIDKVDGLFQVGLGCVDSAPFLDGGAPTPCGAAGGGGASQGSGGDAGASQGGGGGALESVAGEGGAADSR